MPAARITDQSRCGRGNEISDYSYDVGAGFRFTGLVGVGGRGGGAATGSQGDILVRSRGLEPPRVAPLAPQASASTTSATTAGWGERPPCRTARRPRVHVTNRSTRYKCRRSAVL